MTTPAKKSTILVVDDFEENIRILGGILSPEYEVLVATNGERALLLTDGEHPPDLILLDIMMPGIDGYEVCRRLKANPRTRRIPVLFVTAKNEDVNEAKGLELGAVDFLAKPVSPVIVRARVKTHLKLAAALGNLENQTTILQENLRLREDIEHISRHDLKGPLSVFFTVPELLMQEKNLSPRQVRYLGTLDRAAHRMLEMINRSLDLVRMERGVYEVTSVAVDLVRVFRQVFSQLMSHAEHREVKTRLIINGNETEESSVFIIPGEEKLYYSLFANLIKNALEASPDNEEVVVSLMDSPSYVIEVKNRGEIPESIRGRFFEKYTTSGKGDGTGLGVYSARLMARTLGGDLRYQTGELQTRLIFELARGSATQVME